MSLWESIKALFAALFGRGESTGKIPHVSHLPKKIEEACVQAEVAAKHYSTAEANLNKLKSAIQSTMKLGQHSQGQQQIWMRDLERAENQAVAAFQDWEQADRDLQELELLHGLQRQQHKPLLSRQQLIDFQREIHVQKDLMERWEDEKQGLKEGLYGDQQRKEQILGPASSSLEGTEASQSLPPMPEAEHQPVEKKKPELEA